MSAKPTAVAPPIYTKTGDDGTTGLLFGGRVSKADAVIETCGTLDEAVAALGLGRAALEDSRLQEIVLNLQRDPLRGEGGIRGHAAPRADLVGVGLRALTAPTAARA